MTTFLLQQAYSDQGNKYNIHRKNFKKNDNVNSEA